MIYSICVFKKVGDNNILLLAKEKNVKSFSWLTRKRFREYFTFASRELAKKISVDMESKEADTLPPIKIYSSHMDHLKVENELHKTTETMFNYTIHIYKPIINPDVYTNNDIYITAISDLAYPAKFMAHIAQSISDSLIQKHHKTVAETYREDIDLELPIIAATMKKYPDESDLVIRDTDKTLPEFNETNSKITESNSKVDVLDVSKVLTDELLDILVGDSRDLSSKSKKAYQIVRKLNGSFFGSS